MKFPDSPMFAGLNAPSRIEADVNDLEIEGEVPRDIDLFEATQIASGPVATVRIPLRLKPAYHGSWSDAQYVKSADLA